MDVPAFYHPTLEHWLPLIYAADTADENDKVSVQIERFDLGSLSIRNFILG